MRGRPVEFGNSHCLAACRLSHAENGDALAPGPRRPRTRSRRSLGGESERTDLVPELRQPRRSDCLPSQLSFGVLGAAAAEAFVPRGHASEHVHDQRGAHACELSAAAMDPRTRRRWNSYRRSEVAVAARDVLEVLEVEVLVGDEGEQAALVHPGCRPPDSSRRSANTKYSLHMFRSSRMSVECCATVFTRRRSMPVIASLSQELEQQVAGRAVRDERDERDYDVEELRAVRAQRLRSGSIERPVRLTCRHPRLAPTPAASAVRGWRRCRWRAWFRQSRPR